MVSIQNDPIQQLIDVKTQLIIDLGRAIKDAARVGPAGDLTAVQQTMKEKLPEADRRWQHSLNELEMQILDAKAIFTRDLERIRPKGSISVIHNYLQGNSTPAFTTPAPPKPTPVLAPTPTPIVPQQTPIPVPIPGQFKNTPVPPPIIPPGAIPSAPPAISNSGGTYSASITPIPPPATARNSASPLMMKKEPSSTGRAKSAGISKATSKKASPALTKAQLAKTAANKSPKKNSPAISKAVPAINKASPAVGKASPAISKVIPTGKTVAAGRKNSPAPTPETGFTNAGFGLAEQKQTPVPPPQIPIAATKPKLPSKKKASATVNKKSTSSTPTPSMTTTTVPTPVISAPTTQQDTKVSFAPVDSSGDIFISDAPSQLIQNNKSNNVNIEPKPSTGAAPLLISMGPPVPQPSMGMDLGVGNSDLMMGFQDGGSTEFTDMFMDSNDVEIDGNTDMSTFTDDYFTLN